MYKRVLVPFSGKPRGDGEMNALKKAVQLCEGVIILIHVTEPVAQTLGGDQRQEIERENSALGMTALTPAITELKLCAVPFHTRVESGTIADSIVRVADEENADLIVMHTDGQDSLDDVFFGSITARVLRGTDVDLLATR